jgi:transposase
MDIAVLAIDLGKTVCSLAGVDGTGAVVLRKRVQRFRLLEFLARLAPCVVAMEACGGAHHVGRFCLQFGHEPRLMSPLCVRPYVKVHKNDDRDAEGIAEAATRPTMSFVPIKTEEQLDLQALHRARERPVQDRTRLINQARGFLMERGVRPALGRHVFQKFLTRLTEDHSGDPTPRMLAMLPRRIVARYLKRTARASQSNPEIMHLALALGIEPQEAQCVQRYQNRRSGIGQNGNPQAGQPQNRGYQEHCFQAKRDGHILADIGHGRA